jgi:cephalosporin hydroxylase
VRAAYHHHLQQPSDMRHHLPLLYSLARGLVVELGCNAGVSTSALLAGVAARGGQVVSVDWGNAAHLYTGVASWNFLQGDSTNPATVEAVREAFAEPVRLLLLDTAHSLEHVTTELELWAPLVAPGGTICVHDTELFPGVRRAVQTFADARGWPVTFVLPDNGMAILEVPHANGH